MNLKNSKNIKSFFDKYFWGQHPEAALRYAPVVAEIKKSNLLNSKILEIGSGSLGVTPYLKKHVDALDVDFSGPKSPFINKIKGKAWELPFRKNAYDVSISADVLEHISPRLREKSIYEMLRVTKKLAIIVVPTSQESEKQDEELRNYWNKIFKIKNQFLEEHVRNGLPASDEILVYADRAKRALNKKITIKSYPNLNLIVRNYLMKTWISRNIYIYYLYMKGYLLLLPVLRHANFGKTYRQVFVIKFSQ